MTTTQTDTPSATTDAGENPNSYPLETPIKRPNGEIASITLRKPASGELRGLQLSDLLQLDVDSLHKLLPRISQPTITEHEAKAMDPVDLLQLGGKVVSFLLPKGAV